MRRRGKELGLCCQICSPRTAPRKSHAEEITQKMFRDSFCYNACSVRVSGLSVFSVVFVLVVIFVSVLVFSVVIGSRRAQDVVGVVQWSLDG